jgi:hypothetical protein
MGQGASNARRVRLPELRGRNGGKPLQEPRQEPVVEGVTAALIRSIHQLDLSIPAVTEAPNRMGDRIGVSCYLYQFIPLPPVRQRASVLQAFTARFLITAWDRDKGRADEHLGRMLFALQANPEFDVDPAGVPVEIWRAFDIEPRPSIVVAVPVRTARPIEEAPPVKEVVIDTRSRESVEPGDGGGERYRAIENGNASSRGGNDHGR